MGYRRWDREKRTLARLYSTKPRMFECARKAESQSIGTIYARVWSGTG